MTVVMAVIVARNAGNLSEAFAIVFLGGVIRIAFGALRLGRYVSYTPYSVVSGFMSGIGVIIILIRTLPFFGLPTAAGGPLEGVTKLALPDGDSPLTETERKELRKANGDVAIVFLRGSFSYASARELAGRIGGKATGHKAIIYDFTEAAQMDTSAALALEELIEQAREEHEACFISGLSGRALTTLKSLGVLDGFAEDHKFANRAQAIRAAVQVALEADRHQAVTPGRAAKK